MVNAYHLARNGKHPLQVTSGIIQLNIATIAGPVVWFLAVATTPFGLPSWSKRPSPEPIYMRHSLECSGSGTRLYS